MNSNTAMRAMLSASGVSAAELSRRLGKSLSYGTAMLAQRSDLRTGTLATIADALGYCLEIRHEDTGELLGSIDPVVTRRA